MKKILILLTIFLLFGCDNLINTPTKKVERFLEKYQMLDDSLLNELSYKTESSELTQQEKNTYRNLMKRQYSDLIYEVKDEEIDGNIAIVKVEIEVYDYSLANKKTDEYVNTHLNEFLIDNKISQEKYLDYKLNIIKEIKDRIKYTLSLTLSRKNKNWIMDELSEETLQKINGVFVN